MTADPYARQSQALTRDRLETVLAQICAKADLDPTGAQLIKFTNSAVFRLDRAPVVVRIAGSQTVRDRVPKVIAVARWLAEHNMPAVRLYPEVHQPVRAGGDVATLWQLVANAGPAPTGADLGRILREYHSLPPPAFPLPQWQPLAPIRQRLAEADTLDRSDHNFLLAKSDEVENALAGLRYELPSGPIHGDGFVGNLIAGPDSPVICDFDSAAYGPREWDLTPVAVGRLRFAYPGNAHDGLVEAYGVDVMKWPGFPVLRQLRELQLVTSVVPVLAGNPNLAEQWRHRLTTFRSGDQGAKWIPYR